MIRIGNKVKLNDNPFDEQIPKKLEKYYNLKDKIHTVIGISKGGFLIKTDLYDGWLDRNWFDIMHFQNQKED